MEPSDPNKNIIPVDINKEMQEAYLQYSMSVIVGRALPDVRDGLKPVHRRILFAMHELNNTHDKAYKKSARVVGDVIGKYHPHGDTAVYDTMVRMAQDFSLRYPIIDGQGNFGSVDGDSPAAQRYTEVRMTKLAEELLVDLDKDTVPFGPNYDDSLEIPLVLPAKFPNLLINGSSGIAVGMATNIPPHNLSEVIDGCIELIRNPSCKIDDLIRLVPGPDFPTGGIIAGKEGILSAYKRGRGVITLKAEYEIVSNKTRDEIIVNAIPYQVNKAKLIESMADLVRDKKVEGIDDIRDESSREGMRIVIALKRNENAQVVLNRLFKYTQLQISYGIIMLALDDKNQPRTFDLKSMLQAFIDYRRAVVTRRSLFELKKAQARLHILSGLKIALSRIDEIVATIRSSKEVQLARRNLQANFELSEAQAQAILEMRLQRLTGLEAQKILDEIEEVKKKIEFLTRILGDVQEIYKIIVDELTDIRQRFGDSRKTQIDLSTGDIDDEDLITSEDVVVTMTDQGYIKRIPIDQYRLQKRGGKGLKGAETGETDFVAKIFVVDTKTTLLVFTDKGKVYGSKVYRLPMGSRTSKGRSIANVVSLGSNEKVCAVLPVAQFSANRFVVMVTQRGVIKKTKLDSLSHPRTSGLIALTTDLDDLVVDVKVSDGTNDIFLCTHEGMSIRFSENDVRSMGRTARGVKAITLGKTDRVVGMEVLTQGPNQTLLIVTEAGFGKRSQVVEYRQQSRGGVGVITQKTTDRVGKVVGANLVTDKDEVIVTTNKGQVIRVPCSGISVIGRNTQGVCVISLNGDELVQGLAVITDTVINESENTSHHDNIGPASTNGCQGYTPNETIIETGIDSTTDDTNDPTDGTIH